MNRHIFGAPNGLPLENLQKILLGPISRNIPLLPWAQVWSAKIIDDELFLSAVHSCVLYEGSPTELRTGIDRCSYHICPHISTTSPFDFPLIGFEEIPELEAPSLDRSHRPSSDVNDLSFTACRDVARFCSWCLTDFTITIEWVGVRERLPGTAPATARKMGLGWKGDQIRHWYEAEPHEKPEAAGWQITITAYHQLGSCRTPRDWKWMALAPNLYASKIARDTTLYPPGTVMQKWQKSTTP